MSKARDWYLKLIEKGPEGWLQKIVFWCLFLPGVVFGLIARLRSCFYQSRLSRVFQASVPVISVGNLTVGGTGKTPVVDYLVKYFLDLNVNVAVVSRGYGGSYKGDFLRIGVNGAMSADLVGDEPFLLAKNNPEAAVYISRDRRLGVAAAEADGAECIVLDDAFQHFRVARELDILLLDAKRPFGNGCLFPAGPLREAKHALQRADLLIFTRATTPSVAPCVSGVPLSVCTHRIAGEVSTLAGQIVPMDQLLDLRGVAFAGIASPEHFFHTLGDAGLRIVHSVAFTDHCEYDQNLLDRLDAAASEADYLITTEKDAVKLIGKSFNKPCYVTRLEIHFLDAPALQNKLQDVLQCIHNNKEARCDE